MHSEDKIKWNSHQVMKRTVSLRRNVPQSINDVPVFAETLKFTERTLRETVTSESLHSFCSLSYDTSIVSSKVSFPKKYDLVFPLSISNILSIP